MCGGKDNNGPVPPAHPIELPDRTNRPSTSHRPKTSQRPTTSGQRPPTSSRPPRTSDPDRRKSSHGDRPRPGSSSTRPSKTSDGRRRSSHGEHRARSRLPEVVEQSEDRTIITRFGVLNTFIGQHAENFFPHNGPSSQFIEEFDDPHTRHANIRRYLAQTIISRTVKRDGNSQSDRSAIVREIFAHLAPYANALDEQRRNHILQLCELGSNLRDAIQNHSSRWKFDFDGTEGYIVMFPALRQEGEEVLPSEMFRIN